MSIVGYCGDLSICAELTGRTASHFSTGAVGSKRDPKWVFLEGCRMFHVKHFL